MNRRATGALEREVLAQLWATDEALTPGNVLDRMGQPLAYTTVMTILSRLLQKGLVVRERVGRAYAYRPTESEAELTARGMRGVLDRSGDAAAALTHFVGSLSADEERVLRSLLRTLDKGKAKR